MVRKKNILLVLTGGTFGMAEGLPSNTLSPSIDGQAIMEIVPEINDLANIDWISIFNLDSSDISPAHWENIGRHIQKKYDKYNGFVVIHGTDTMVYSATALSFMMKSTSKPVVFTGSQRPLSKIRSDARENLINAIEFASMDIPEICISFGSYLLRACRAKKISSINYDAFQSFNVAALATVGMTINVDKKNLCKGAKPKWMWGFDAGIILIKIFPGMIASLLEQSLMSGAIRGVVLEGFGSGNIPELDHSWLDLINRLKERGVPVILTSQCLHGVVDLNLYESGQKALRAGAISCNDITSEAAVVKLMFALKHYDKYSEIRDFMVKDYCGEQT